MGGPSTGASLKWETFPMTDQLDGGFPNSPVDLEPVDDAFALDTLLRSGEENVQQDGTLSAAQSHTSEPLTVPHRPPNAGPATFPASGTPELLNPDQTPEIHDANNNLSCAAIHTHPAKRMILDESGHQLEDVIKALKEADDTSRIPNSYVPGVSEYLLDKSTSTDYSKIMTKLVLQYIALDAIAGRQFLHLRFNRRDFKNLRGTSWSALLKIDNR
jgi:hypothetical protein